MRFRLCLAGFLWVASMQGVGVVNVTTTVDTGTGSLRQAISDVNVDHTIEQILFNIPPSDPNCDANGVCTIRPVTNLPAIASEGVTIDGYSQPGAQVNTASQGSNAQIKIVLIGNIDTDPSPRGLEIEADNVAVKGLAIGGFLYGIRTSFVTGTQISGCFLGTDASGQTPSPNQWAISCLLASNAIIGSASPADRNVISASTTAGVNLDGCPGSAVLGNLIGTNAAGDAPLGNVAGIYATGASSNLTIGGPGEGAGNVVSGSSDNGIFISLGANVGVIIYGNKVGTDAGGSAPIGNALAGIRIASPGVQIGGLLPGQGNVVAYNLGKGIGVDSSGYGVTIRGNSIYENGYGNFGYHTGIDLEPQQGTTANDDGDADTGANGLQNTPIVSSAAPHAGGGTDVTGVEHSTADTVLDIDFYENEACQPLSHNFLQGRSYIGSTQVTTDASGFAAFAATLPATIAAGAHVSATATDAQGNTSEFSQRMPWVVNPLSGPASGGTAIGVGGTDFLTGATVTIGGAPAADVDVLSFTGLTATTPALSPGTLNDVVVSDPDGASGVLEMSFVADFLDVPPSHQFYPYVTELVYNRLTAGIGGGLYGVEMAVLRQQMAVFILKAEHGVCYAPPDCKGTFADVPCPSPFADWVEQLFTEGITGGCGGGNYCPTSPVRRDQMSAFLLKAEHGESYVPPDCAGIFGDVPCPSLFANWIEQLAAENITGGCGNGNYCPLSNNTRGQMAVFITKTFGLQ